MSESPLTQTQYDILKYLVSSGNCTAIDEIVGKLGIDQVFVFSSIQYMQELGYTSIYETEVTEISLLPKIELIREYELTEKTILKELDKAGIEVHIQELSRLLDAEQKIIGKALKPMLDKKWIAKNGPAIVITNEGRAAIGVKGADELLFDLLLEKKVLAVEEASVRYDFFADGFEQLKKRGQTLSLKSRKRRTASVTEQGKKFFASIRPSDIKEEVTSLTSELIQDRKWTNVIFKHYDIQADAESLQMGRIHPFQRLLNQVRNIFYGMGFSEVASPHIESSFWDFDALFQPQDHPARDMQDTFYLDNPKTGALPEQSLVDLVKATHENGGTSGSTGWGYKWNYELAKKMVLRTHTTAASIQQIHRNPSPPARYFCIGRVFRREAIDYKHLPVFTQVDGIIVEKNASLSHLIGILSEFYKRMGFAKIDIRPSFFPYTEPSLEIHVWLDSKKDWVEMGGAGVFRKEVTVPMGCDAPVLAWGLGMERLAMINYNLDDLRKIYISNIRWLREEPLCQ
jgi:phenylalanyl-tRNA synthetase alpha chain